MTALGLIAFVLALTAYAALGGATGSKAAAPGSGAKSPDFPLEEVLEAWSRAAGEAEAELVEGESMPEGVEDEPGI